MREIGIEVGAAMVEKGAKMEGKGVEGSRVEGGGVGAVVEEGAEVEDEKG